MTTRNPHHGVNRIIRELLSADLSDERNGTAAWLLAAIEHVLHLDETLDPREVETPAGRHACAMAIRDLRESFDAYNAAAENSTDNAAAFLLH